MDITWSYAWEAALATFELAIALEADTSPDSAVTCTLFARAVRSALCAELLLAGEPTVMNAGNNLVRLQRALEVLRVRKYESIAVRHAALFSRVLVITSADWGPDFVVRELFDELDIRICSAAARRFVDQASTAIFGLTLNSLLGRHADLRTVAWMDPAHWCSLLPASEPTP